jgi:hypothetical protein
VEFLPPYLLEVLRLIRVDPGVLHVVQMHRVAHTAHAINFHGARITLWPDKVFKSAEKSWRCPVGRHGCILTLVQQQTEEHFITAGPALDGLRIVHERDAVIAGNIPRQQDLTLNITRKDGSVENVSVRLPH